MADEKAIPVAQKRWLNINEAAAYSGYTVGTLYKKVEKREFPFSRLPGSRLLRFDRLAIDKHFEKFAIRAVEFGQGIKR